MVDYVEGGSNGHTPSLVPYLTQLEHKPKPVLLHNIGAGAPCLKCNCSGLELHYWRKVCMSCKCRADEHDIELPSEHEYGVMLNRRLQQNRSPGRLNDTQINTLTDAFRSRKENQATGVELGSRHGHAERADASETTETTASSYNESKEELQVHSELEWTPTDDPQLLSLYMQQMPEDERPIRGTKGVQKRRQRLQYQLPAHDCYPDKAKSVQTEEIREELQRFVRRAQENVAMGKVVRTDETSLRSNEFWSPESKLDDLHKTKLTCRECKHTVMKDSVGILPTHSHADKKDIWHPACFKCEQCHDLLVDLLYFFKEGQYLCGRHFCERNFERCAGCDELILDKQYTRAENQSWHVQHFCCFGCDKHFVDEDYVLKQNQFYCLNCYLVKFAKTCLGCGQKIAATEPCVTHNELHWHKRPACFRCRTCAKFLESKFLLKTQSTYCSDRCKKEFERIL